MPQSDKTMRSCGEGNNWTNGQYWCRRTKSIATGDRKRSAVECAGTRENYERQRSVTGPGTGWRIGWPVRCDSR
jgi:hypothetical protein